MTQPSVPFDLPPDDPPPAANGSVAPDLEKSERERSAPKGKDKRGGMQETRREVHINGAPKPPPKDMVDMAREDWSNPDAWPTNADTLWPLIIAHLAKDGVGPEQVIVYVYRMNVGQFVADKDKVKIGTIKGDSIKPYGGMSASEAQFYYLLNTFHCVPAPNGCGKSHYELEYRYVNGRPIKTGYLDLDSYGTLRAIADRATEIGGEINKAMQSEASGQPGKPPPIMPMPGQPSYFSNPGAVPGGMSPEGYMELGHLRAMKEEFDRARAEGRAPRDIPNMMGAPGNDAAIAWEREKAQLKLDAEKGKQELELKIRDMEMKAAADAAARDREALLNRLASLEARLNSPGESDEAKMLKHLIALGVVKVGPDGKPLVGAAAAHEPPPPLGPSVDDMLKDPVQFAKFEKARTEYREQVRRVHGFADPSTEIVEREEKEIKKEPTWIDKVLAVGGGILEGAVKNPEGPLTALATFTKGSQAGQMFEGLASAAAAGKAAVNASRVNSPPSGGGGFKSSA